MYSNQQKWEFYKNISRELYTIIGRNADLVPMDIIREMSEHLDNYNEKSPYHLSIKSTDKDGKAQEKAVSELNSTDLEALVEASKPKSMEDLAKGQLNSSERIEKILGVQIEKENGTVAIVYKEIKFLIEQS